MVLKAQDVEIFLSEKEIELQKTFEGVVEDWWKRVFSCNTINTAERTITLKGIKQNPHNMIEFSPVIVSTVGEIMCYKSPWKKTRVEKYFQNLGYEVVFDKDTIILKY